MFTDTAQYSNAQYLYNKLSDCKFGVNGYDATVHPFYYTGKDDEHNFVSGISNVNSDEIKLIEDFANEANWSNSIKFMYKMIGNTRETYYDVNKDDTCGTLIFHSLDKIKKIYKFYKSKGQTTFTDIAYTYHGMGHIIVASYDSSLGKMFWRPDGGSNGWDRYANVKGVIDMKSEHIECHTFNFMDIFDEFKNRKFNDTHTYITDVDFNNIDESLFEIDD